MAMHDISVEESTDLPQILRPLAEEAAATAVSPARCAQQVRQSAVFLSIPE